MKKILIIITIVLCIFQMVVLATAITIGSSAIDRGGSAGGTYTQITKENPANETGRITTVKIWAKSALAGVKVAIFTEGAANTFTAGDVANIGNVSSGSEQTFNVNLNVSAGDFIGLYWTDGWMELDSSGYGGRWVLAGDQTTCVDEAFTLYGDDGISLGGTGTTEEEGEEANAIFFGINF